MLESYNSERSKSINSGISYVDSQSLRPLRRQFVKYILVGLLSNSLAYALYLVITQLGMSPINVMSIVYAAACITSFTANRRWTFNSEARLSGSFMKYLLGQLLGYGTNFFILSFLYLVLGVPHQAAQLIGISVVAIELFLVNRYYVFA